MKHKDEGDDADVQMSDGHESPGDTTCEAKDEDKDTENYSTYLSSSKPYNVLLIGLSYSEFVIDQYKKDPAITNITMCVDCNGRKIDPCIACDNYRCLVFEESYPSVTVYTVNKCMDALRSNNETEGRNMNYNVGSNQFLKYLKNRELKFHEIYVDTFRMQKVYVSDNFGPNFFGNLGIMVQNGFLVGNEQSMGKVYPPFMPHFFHMVWSQENILKHYNITYLSESEIDASNHKLSYSTFKNDDLQSLNKSTKEEERHITTRRSEILNYRSGWHLSKT